MRKVTLEEWVSPVTGPDLRPAEVVQFVAVGLTKNRPARILDALSVGGNISWYGMKWYYVVLTSERGFVLDAGIVRTGGIRQDAILAAAPRGDVVVESYRKRIYPFSPRPLLSVGGTRFDLYLNDEGKRPGAEIVKSWGWRPIGVS